MDCFLVLNCIKFKCFEPWLIGNQDVPIRLLSEVSNRESSHLLLKEFYQGIQTETSGARDCPKNSGWNLYPREKTLSHFCINCICNVHEEQGFNHVGRNGHLSCFWYQHLLSIQNSARCFHWWFSWGYYSRVKKKSKRFPYLLDFCCSYTLSTLIHCFFASLSLAISTLDFSWIIYLLC